jgi:enterochelin esterase-like enzyme
MVRVENTDLWFRTLKIRRGSRFLYQLSIDDPSVMHPRAEGKRRLTADPLNPHRFPDDVAGVPLTRAQSVAELPGANAQTWFSKRENVPTLVLEKRHVQSAILGDERDVLVYIPPGYSAKAKAYRVLFLFDGNDHDGLAFASWTVENLLADNRIPPLIIVRITHADEEGRLLELACNARFADFLARELVPFIPQRYQVTKDPAKTAIG